MIRYFAQPSLSLGPITIHAFGVLVAVGILIGMRLIRRRAKGWSLDPATAERLTIWILLGGFAGAALFVRHEHLGTQRWPYLDLVAYAFPTSWFFGRTGCFVAFDHPGAATSFFLAERYTDGVVRHNLGLDEALYTLPVALFFLWLGRGRARAPGFFVGLLAVLYAPARFLLDSLRLVDVRYLGFTPGQYGAAALIVVGALILWRVPAQREAQPLIAP
jgi:phosphatidylglycerol:prolipoprotein diacylglycerol transferase